MDKPQLLRTKNVGYRLDRHKDYVRIQRGIYQHREDYNQNASDPASRHITRIFASAAKLPQGSLISHTSAARIYGFTLEAHQQDVHIYQPFPSSGQNSSEIIRHTAVKGTFTPHERNGLRLVDPIRTIIDCIRTLPIDEAFILADSAAAILSQTNRFQQAETLQRWHKIHREIVSQLEVMKGVRGIRQARAVAHYMSPFADSPGESRLRLLCLQLNLPRPTLQPLMVLEDHQIFPDLLWKDQGQVTIAEYDGAIKYASSRGIATEETLYNEKIREDRIRRARINVVRFIHGDLYATSAPMLQLCSLVRPEVNPHPLNVFLHQPERRRRNVNA